MDETLSSEPDSEVSKELRPDAHPSKRRKVAHEKTVVTVKIGSNVGNLKNEGPPSDLWSWRKYGQKPIKGSPYPRGYYRCSTSKGCSAKKQVERSKTDASVLIITYTCSHNHPGPDDLISTADLTAQSSPKQPQMEKQPKTEDQDQEQELDQEQEQEQGKLVGDTGDHFHYIESPIRCSQVEEDPFRGTGTHSDNDIGFLLDEKQEKEPPISYSQLMSFSSTPKSSQENDFFDELEELPTFSSSFPSFVASSNFSLETIPSVPS